MIKTAEQIADTVLAKYATSRWREAIRSGEIAPGPAAEALKARMGVTQARESAGLNRGTMNILKQHGFKYEEMSPMKSIRRLLDMSDGGLSSRAAGFGARSVREVENLSTRRVGGAVTLPGDYREGRVVVHPKDLDRNMKILGGEATKKMKPNDWRALKNLVIRHEGDEVRNLLSDKAYQVRNPNTELVNKALGKAGPSLRATATAMGKGKLDQDLLGSMAHLTLAKLPVYSGNHFSPQILLEERRNQRMLSPAVQDTFTAIRERTGETAHRQQAARALGIGEESIPRHKMKALTRGMSDIAEKEQEEMRRRLIGKANKPLPGEGIARKAVSKFSDLSKSQVFQKLLRSIR